MPLEEKGMAVRIVEMLPSAVGLMGGVTGQVSASVVNVVTAESRGQVTAVGTVTANVKGTITAQVSGGPVGVTGGPLYSQYASTWLISGQSATGTGVGMDSRPYSVGYVYCNFSGNSASASILASHNSATWMVVTSYYTGQLTADCQFTAQLNAYYPYLAGRVSFVSASGGVTAGVWMNISRV
jgi:hypothetical protein